MSDTPRTDALIHSSLDLSQSTIAEFAQTLERENAAQLSELHRISEALGTNEGHSSVTHIESLKKENAALREQLKDCSAAFDRQQEQLDRNAEQIATLREALSRLIEVHDAIGGMCSPERILAEAALAKEEGK